MCRRESFSIPKTGSAPFPSPQPSPSRHRSSELELSHDEASPVPAWMLFGHRALPPAHLILEELDSHSLLHRSYSQGFPCQQSSSAEL